MSITTVLFDLDGTLLPMDQDLFTKSYFKLLAKKVAHLGFEAAALVDGIWAGTKAMVMNNGTQTNEEAFWKKFAGIFGDWVLEHKAVFEEFYRVEFQQAKAFCGFNPKASDTVEKLKKKGIGVALATNPIFPQTATISRIGWAGLNPADFDMVTTYENSCFSKPNLAYYRDLLSRLGRRAEECLMVGNDVSEDMVAEKLGMKVFLLTDCLINREGKDISAYPCGSFDSLQVFLKKEGVLA